ncbi:Ltp family lipoprotein [Solirubrobacter sp. CPCC 204708]|uniref:Ltp family lipoprotein n=1 Tax=Solirubrobacter deserti TaxID=2282478 RepID=A0ABT4RBL9_9ACTN|nr:Ltp family lipoprotein [Solirubrobacter deserti]MBE2317173.1 Ltp family lipoprotein [Solirubrobacter deserti]MDA0135934.1 Ltp family lipoprotein [Solirubrobacter deserti]
MKALLKWGLAGLVCLGILGAVFGEDEQTGEPQGAAAVSAATATPEPESVASAEPTPTPKPQVSISVTGPSSARRDNVTLRGTVDPANARVRIKGKSVKVRRGKWTAPITLSKRGENSFRVVATRKGFVKATETAVITRKLSTAEKAAARREKARRRAMRRALESAESYLETMPFSKQGLYEQLTSEYGAGFTAAEAQYAVDHVKADWKREAVEAAESYLETMPMSRQALIEQLTSEYGSGFTYDQAVYAVDKVY